MRLRRPYAGPCGGYFSTVGATGAVVVCALVTVLCIAGGAILYGGGMPNFAMQDTGLSASLASRLGSLRNQANRLSKKTEAKKVQDCPEKIECPPPLYLPHGDASVPIPILESLPLPNIEDVWGDFSRWGDWTMKRYWDEETLKNAIRASDPSQLYPIIQKLQAGEPIIVVGIGSSIVADFGGIFHKDLEMVYKLVPNPSHKFYQRGQPENASTAPSANYHRGWIELFMQYINQTWPHPDHLLINAGRAAATPKIFADGSCIEYMLPQQADLVIIESMGFTDLNGFETLSWRVLRHFKEQESLRPAIVYFNTIDVAPQPPQGQPGWGTGCGKPPGSNLTECCTNFTRSGIEAGFTSAGNRYPNDGQHHEVARLYGFGSISHRDFLWPYIRAKAWELLTPEYGECGYVAITNSDSIHPSQFGKVLFADYLWTYLNIGKVAYARRHALHYLTAKENDNNISSEENEEEKSTMSTDVVENTVSSEPSIEEVVDRRWKNAKLPLLDSLLGMRTGTFHFPLPEKPFSAEGRNVYSTRCYGFLATETSPYHQGSEHGLVGTLAALPIIKTEGFEFHENTTHGTVVKRKPGWIAMDVGAFMELENRHIF